MPLRRFFPRALLTVCLCAAIGGTALPVARGAFNPAPLPVLPAQPSAAFWLHSAAPYLVDAAKVADNEASFTPEGAVEIYHLRYERVVPSGLSGIVVQRVFQIRTQPAADMFALDDLWYDSSRSEFQLVRADVLRHGTVLSGHDAGNVRAHGGGNQPREVTLPQLQAGDRINVEYVLLPDRTHDWAALQGRYLGNLFAFRDAYPSERVDYLLAASQPLSTNAVGVGAAVTSAAPGDYTWHWHAENQAEFLTQNNGPSITDRSPFVQVSGFQSWGELANWYGNLLAERAQPEVPKGTAPEARIVPASFTTRVATSGAPRSGETVEGTVERVWGYLSPRLDYRGDETGIHAYVPAPVDEVLQAKRGDCKDGALLLTTWLRAAGVEAYVALVRTGVMGRLADSDGQGSAAATMAAFDHALVYVPATQEWIDTTAPSFLGSELPASDQGGLALVIRPGVNELVRIPEAAAEVNATRRSVDLTPEPNGWLRARGTIEVRGADAPDLRLRYADPASRNAELRTWLRNAFPQAKVESVQVHGVMPSDDTVRVAFVADILPAAQMTAAWTPRHYTLSLASQAARDELLRLPLRWTLDETWALHLASASACASYPAGSTQQRSGPYGAMTISSDCSRAVFQVHTQVSQDAEQVAPAHYADFRVFWQGVDADLNAPLTRAAVATTAKAAASIN